MQIGQQEKEMQEDKMKQSGSKVGVAHQHKIFQSGQLKETRFWPSVKEEQQQELEIKTIGTINSN